MPIFSLCFLVIDVVEYLFILLLLRHLYFKE